MDCCTRTMTREEMVSVTSYTLDAGGTRITIRDGSVWLWDVRFEHWVMWRSPTPEGR